MMRFSSRVSAWKKIFTYVELYKNKLKELSVALFLSFAILIVGLLTQYAIFVSLGYSLPLPFTMTFVSMIILITGHIPSVNGLGVQALLNVAVFSLIGIPLEVAFVAAVVYHITGFLVSVVCTFVFERNRHK